MSVKDLKETPSFIEVGRISRAESDEEINKKGVDSDELYTFRSVKEFENLMQKKLNKERVLRYGSQELLTFK